VLPRRIDRAASLGAAAVLAAAALAACGASSAEKQPTTPRATSTGPEAAVGASNGLALDLLRTISADPTANTAFSPYSIQAALSMVDTGAVGKTTEEINHVLRAASAESLAASNATLAARLADATKPPPHTPANDAPQLHIANGLWVQSGLALKDPFTQTLNSAFGAPPRQTDFQHKPDKARSEINDWVAGQTAGRIQNLMPPGSIDGNTALVLANAIYLKAHWTNTFDPAATAPAAFVVKPGTIVTPEFMSLGPTILDYVSARDYTAVDLPYLGSTLSMLVVMPAPGTLATFQKRLTPAALSQIEGSLTPTRVHLRMPKLHLKTHIDLVSVLSALGMPIAFSTAADFSGITASPPLAIGAVQHAADIAVDEQGTVAAAATGISAIATAVAPSKTTTFVVDHPFLLFLRDDRTGAILFTARVSDPTQS
jgi:serpin B